MTGRTTRLALALLAALLMSPMAACEDPGDPVPTDGASSRFELVEPAAVPLTAVPVGGETVELWPYTGTSIDGARSDPVNLIFTGVADPRNIRDALLSLGNVRSRPFALFTCLWTDAIGGIQAAYAEPRGWSGSVIQVECGDYSTVRFHVRLFPVGDHTLANAHFDVLIPGTPEHQVLAWELAEQFVVYEMSRAAVLAAAPAPTGLITTAPTFRSIPAPVYNGLPSALKALTGGPSGPVSEPVGIPNDGRATVLVVAEDVPGAGGTTKELALTFGQVIPKPFCAEPGELIRVDGPVRLTQEVSIDATGGLTSQTVVDGTLQIRTYDAATQALGEPMPAEIRDHYHTLMEDETDFAKSSRHQILVRPSGANQQLQAQLRVGPGSEAIARISEICK
jgi:hypothetical protein